MVFTPAQKAFLPGPKRKAVWKGWGWEDLNYNPNHLCQFWRPYPESHLQERQGFSDSSVGKESTCNAEDPSSIPGSWRSTGEGIGYPLQYCWASLVAQLVKNPPAMQETWVWSLGWEDPLEKGKATHSSILPWRMPWTIQSQRVRQSWYWVSDCWLVFSLLTRLTPVLK